MPVLEITQLRLKGITVADPALLENLSAVRDSLQTNSVFYSCIEDPNLVYIFGIWRSLDAHLQFLASPARDQVLGPQEDILGFEWTVHQRLDETASLPLEFPILVIERLLVQERNIDTFDHALDRHARHLQGNCSAKFSHGWRCDAPEGTHEAIIFSGWEDTETHVSFSAGQQREGVEGNTSIERGAYEEVLVHHLWNMERQTL